MRIHPEARRPRNFVKIIFGCFDMRIIAYILIYSYIYWPKVTRGRFQGTRGLFGTVPITRKDILRQVAAHVRSIDAPRNDPLRHNAQVHDPEPTDSKNLKNVWKFKFYIKNFKLKNNLSWKFIVYLQWRNFLFRVVSF